MPATTLRPFWPGLVFVVCTTLGLYFAFPNETQPTESQDYIEPAQSGKHQPTIQVIRATNYIKHVNKKLPDEDAKKFAAYVVDYAATFKIDLSVFLAMVRKESTFNPDSVSKDGAIGLAQVVPRWHHQKIKSARTQVDAYSIHEPRLNLYVGAWVLRDSIDESKGNVARGLLRYNGSLNDPEQQYATSVLAEAQYVRKAFLN